MNDRMVVSVENAIRSLYQAIILVNRNDYSCQLVDYNRELSNISSNIKSFDLFCEELYINIHPEDREEFLDFINPDYFPQELITKVHASYECRIRRADGRYYWSDIIFCNATNEDTAGGSDYLFLIQDIHDWKLGELKNEAEERAILKSLQEKYNALFEENMIDAQTGCYNRKGMKYYSDMVIDEARSTGKNLFVCVADINGLKYLNDSFGHVAGDEAIAVVAAELLKSAPKGSRIVRTGGDEFLIFAAINKDSTEPQEMNSKIDIGLKKYNEENPHPFTIDASYGWVVMPIMEEMVNMDEYVAMADARMYEMKIKKDKHRRG